MKKILLVFCLLTVCFAVIACGKNNGGQKAEETSPTVMATPTEKPQEDKMVLEATEANVRPIGRTIYDFGRMCAFSGTGAEFHFEGKRLIIKITGDAAATKTNNDTNYARIGIYVNGERMIDDMIDKPIEDYVIFDGTEKQSAVVQIVKLSETAMSTFRINAIETDGEGSITPTEEKPYLIEFIGDSITCGYGVDDEDANHHFSTATEDCTKAYAYKTAKLLGADYSLVSISGYGIITGYSGDGETKVESQRIPTYYTKLGYSYASTVPAATEWDFTNNRQPDVVVINLGTNDDSYCKQHKDRQQEYIDGYVAFLKTVREKNPDAYILCTLGIMGDNLYPCVEEAAARYTAETGDSNIGTMPFTPQLAEDGIAADWHPTERTHTKAAEKLSAVLAGLLK